MDLVVGCFCSLSSLLGLRFNLRKLQWGRPFSSVLVINHVSRAPITGPVLGVRCPFIQEFFIQLVLCASFFWLALVDREIHQ